MKKRRINKLADQKLPGKFQRAAKWSLAKCPTASHLLKCKYMKEKKTTSIGHSMVLGEICQRCHMLKRNLILGQGFLWQVGAKRAWDLALLVEVVNSEILRLQWLATRLFMNRMTIILLIKKGKIIFMWWVCRITSKVWSRRNVMIRIQWGSSNIVIDPQSIKRTLRIIHQIQNGS